MNRVAFTLFGIPVMWYGLLIGIGMLLAIYFSLKEARRVNVKEDDILNIALFAIPIAVICARAYYVIFNWGYYAANPSEILAIRSGGLAIHGGLIGGIATGLVYCRLKKLPFFKMADIALLGLPLAQSIGRWGNFVNQEAHGGPTTLPWGIMIDGQKVHPTFLYESIWDFLLFLLLMKLRKNKKYDGQIVSVYLVVYSLGRFFIEGLRTDSLMLGPLRMAQVISICLMVAGIVMGYVLKKKSRV